MPSFVHLAAVTLCVFGATTASAQEFRPLFEPVTPPRTFQVMAHRGLMRQAPENSKAALEACIAHGIEWAEVDVRLTRDGKHVIAHNDELDAKSSGHGKISEHTLDELRVLDSGTWFAPRFSREKILTLAECLEVARGRLNLYLDCKVVDPESLVREVLGAKIESQVIVYDDEATIAQVRELAGGQIPVMTKWRPSTSPEDWMTRVRADAVEIDADEVTPEVVAKFHAKGIRVQAKVLGDWDKPEMWRAMVVAGVDWLQTDLADEIIATLFWKDQTDRKFMICCHRGANRFAPENTIPAFEKAVAFGVDYIEFDVRTSSDGACFLLHDGKLDRTTNGKGSLSSQTAEDLLKLDAGAWFGKPHAGIKLPTLDEFLAWSKDAPLLYFDAKDIAPAKLAETLERAGVAERVVVYQGEEFLKLLKGINPSIKRMPPLDELADVDRLSDELQPYFVDADWNVLSKELIDACHARGIRVTSDALGAHEKIEDYTEAVEMGIDMIQTDFPLRVIEASHRMKNTR